MVRQGEGTGMARYSMAFEEAADPTGEIKRARAFLLPLPTRVLRIEIETLTGCNRRLHLTTVFVDDQIILEENFADCTALVTDLDLRLDRRNHSVFVSAAGFAPGEMVKLRVTVTFTMIWFDRTAPVARALADKTGTDLEHRLAQAVPGDYLEIDAYLTSGSPETSEPVAEPSTAIERDRLIERFRAVAAAAQRPLSERLHRLSKARIDLGSRLDGAPPDQPGIAPVRRARGFWITNAIAVEATREVVLELVERPEVECLELEHYAAEAELLDGLIELEEREEKRAGGAEASPSWNVRRINAPRLWDLGLRGQGIVCALIDSGVNYRHPDLAERMWDGGPAYPRHGYNFSEGDDDPVDRQGHGTACAGLIVGSGYGGTVTGVAPGAALMAVRIGTSLRSLWAGVEFAVAQGASVLCLPWSWKLPPDAEKLSWRRLCSALAELGIAHVSSGGNRGRRVGGEPLPDTVGLPASCPPPWRHPDLGPGSTASAVAVGATDSQERLADWSAQGPVAWEDPHFGDYPYRLGTRPGLVKPDLCAPGVATTSCDWRHGRDAQAVAYRTFSGTSAAAAQVAGCLCLLAGAARAAGRPVEVARLQEALEGSAVRIRGQTANKENGYGAGRVDVFAAFRYGRMRDWW